MNILDNKLEEIIANSGLYFYEKEIEAEIDIRSKLVALEDVMPNIWNSLPDDANIAIYGLGYNFYELLGNIDLSTKNVVCIIDKRPDLTEFNGYPVIRVEELPKYNINLVLITPKLYHKEMDENIRRVSPDCKTIDLTGEFTRNSYYVHYIDNRSKLLSLNMAVDIYYKTLDYRYLLYIIRSYLGFRDMKSALVYAEKYINSDFPNINSVVSLKTSLLGLLNDIRQKLSQNSSTHCLLVISDSVIANSITPENAPFLYDFAQKNIYCANAYTHMCWTTNSFLTIFSQKSFFDNRLHRNPVLSETEYFFKYLSENNIEFLGYSHFSKSVLSNIKNLQIYEKGCAGMMWQYLCSAYENDNKAVWLLHFSETHIPWLSLDYVDVPNIPDSLSLYYHSLKYVDSQMEYFLDLLPTSVKLIFCSDHGQYNPEYLKRRCGIPYIIRDKTAAAKTETRLVSHLDTVNIILNLVNDKSAFDGIPERSFAEVNGEFYYSRALLEIMKHDHNNGRAFKCFVTKTDKYVIFYDGEEMYFLLPDDSKNLIDAPEYADRINWFRANVNTEFPDWSDDNGRYDITREYMDLNKRIKK